MAQKIMVVALVLVGSFSGVVGCSDGGGSSKTQGRVNDPVVTKVTEQTYLSGKKFCETYKDITGKEYGRYVKVPKSYEHPDLGSIEVYAYTLKPFNARKPSYIYVDGGPGQNTHGLMPEYLDGTHNEIRFDQRGLGCSAPETWQTYKDSSLYSSLNNIRDMEEIRKAYGIDRWSVYGVSYGTVPATMYGSAYSNSTRSVVIEGVFGRTEQTHSNVYKAEKMNLMLQKLNYRQQQAFSRLMDEESADARVVLQLMFQMFYYDAGGRQTVSYLQKIFGVEGDIQRGVIQQIRQKFEARASRYPNPQQPGAVDENILQIIYCKNLGARQKPNVVLFYNENRGGFYTQEVSKSDQGEECDEVGVSTQDEQPYKLEDHRVDRPVYYFQGSHDGATMASGALTHLEIVPQAASYFLLAQKGGHNPNLERLDDTNQKVVTGQKALFRMAIEGREIRKTDLDQVNLYKEADFKWLLFLNHNERSAIEEEFQGIQRQVW